MNTKRRPYKTFFERKVEKKGGYRNKKTEPIHGISFKVKFKFDRENEDHDMMMDRLEEERRIEARLQRQIASWWRKETGKNFIVIVEYGSKVKDTISVKVELSQLNLQEEEIDKFIEGTNKIVRGEMV